MTVIELVTALTEMMEDDNRVANMKVQIADVFEEYSPNADANDVSISPMRGTVVIS